MSVSYECAKWEHLDVEADPSSVYRTASLCLLLFHSIFVPLPIVLDPLIDAFSANDAEVSQSIIGEVENLGISVMCPHEVVCHDCDETPAVLVHTIQDEFLQNFIELVCLIEYEIDRFHFLFTLSIW